MNKRTEESKTYLSQAPIHAQWESDYLNADMDRFYDAAFDKILDALRPSKDQTLLDAGCGYGFHALRLAKSGMHVTGLDFSEVALEQARKNAEQAGRSDQLEFVQGDLLNLPFEDAKFDYVHCWGVLMHIPEVERALSELSRVLKPGGRLILMENNSRSADVVLVERMLRLAKVALRLPLRERSKTPRGVEEWFAENDGGLLVRKTDMGFLTEFLGRQGLTLERRFSGQFTELYTNLPSRWLKRRVYKFNLFWLSNVEKPGLALGNILIFKKADG